MSHRNPPTPVPFWRLPKTQDVTSTDFRPKSDDLDLFPNEWIYRKASYENSLADIVKAERNLAKLEKGINPNQR